MGLKVLFSGDFWVLEAHYFFGQWFSESQIKLSFFVSIWSLGVEFFRVHI